MERTQGQILQRKSTSIINVFGTRYLLGVVDNDGSSDVQYAGLSRVPSHEGLVPR